MCRVYVHVHILKMEAVTTYICEMATACYMVHYHITTGIHELLIVMHSKKLAQGVLARQQQRTRQFHGKSSWTVATFLSDLYHATSRVWLPNYTIYFTLGCFM